MAGPSVRTAPPNSYLATAVHGLEWVVAAEVAPLASDAESLDLARRKVFFHHEGPPGGPLGLRSADDVFALVGTIDDLGGTRRDLEALPGAVYQLDWLSAVQAVGQGREIPAPSSFDVVASIDGRRRYNRFDVEGAIGRSLEKLLGWRFLERTAEGRVGGTSDLTARVFLEDDCALVALRLAAVPLHRRDYKRSTGPATLHPPVAAMLVTLAGPPPGPMLDPFCGDGTIAIEAKLLDRSLEVIASDIDARRVGHTRANASEAGVEIAVVRRDVAHLRPEDVPPLGSIVTNPPWDRTVTGTGDLDRSLAAFWDSASGLLAPRGLLCVIADTQLGVPEELTRRGWTIGLLQRLRLSGRIVAVTIAGRSGATPELAGPLAQWRQRAVRAGVVDEQGF